MQYKWKMIFNLFGTHGYLTMRYLILENNPPAAQGLAPGIEVSYETAEQNPSFFFFGFPLEFLSITWKCPSHYRPIYRETTLQNWPKVQVVF